MKIDKATLHKLMFLSAYVVFLFWGLDNYKTVLRTVGYLFGLMSPLILGGCIAFLLNLPMSAIEVRLLHKLGPKQQQWKRPLAILLSLLLVSGIALVLLFLVLPELGNTALLIKNNIPHYFDTVAKQIEQLALTYPELESYIHELKLDWQEIINSTATFLQNAGASFLNSTVSVLSAFLSGILKFFIGIIFSFYILAQKETLSKQAKAALYAFLPNDKAKTILNLTRLCNDTFRRFIGGQCIEAVILGAIFFISMSLLQMPYALMISALIGFMSLIPILGALLGCLIGAFLIFMISPIKAVWFVVLFLVLQQIEGNLIYPKVVGNSVGLPPLWVLLAVTAGGSAMGVFGMLVCIPICAVLYAVIGGYIKRQLREKKISEDELKSL